MNQFELINMDGLSDFQRIDQNLKTLIASMEGTIPGSRNFGLPIECIDLNPYQARNAFLAALDEKVAEYIPEIRISDVTFDNIGGEMHVSIYIESNEGAI